MMPTDAMVFADQYEAGLYVAERLPTNVSGPLAEALAHNFVMYCDGSCTADDWPRDPPENWTVDIGAPLDYFEGHWTIRESELHDLKEVAIGVGLAVAERGHGYEAVTVVISAVCMLWRLRRKGVSVNPLQRQVLFALRKKGPLAFGALVETVSASGTEWTEADIEDALTDLKAARLNDGTTEPLVHQANDGMWSTDARGLWEVPRGSSDGSDL
jgi:hypothetical protein